MLTAKQDHLAPSIAKLIAPELIISSGNHTNDDVGKWLATTR
jgi:hypothetical protein